MNNIRDRFLLSLGVAAMSFSAAAHSQAALVAYYPFENNLNDSAGGYHGAIQAGVPTYVAGQVGNAVDLDGATYVSLTTGANLGMGGNFTVSAFINSDNLTGDHTILGNDGGADNSTLHLITRGDKAHLGFYSHDTGGNATLSTGTWTHVAYQYISGQQRIFVNGVADASSGPHSQFAGTANTVNLGRWGGANYFDGRIDNLAVFNNAVSLNQIQYLASGGNPQTLPAATSFVWDFRSGNFNNWTTINGTAHYRTGDGGGITPGGPYNTPEVGWAWDNDHVNLVFRSPAFKFTGLTHDGTNVLSVDWAGGAGDQSGGGPSFANPAAAIAYNGGNSDPGGEKGVAILDTVTGQYVGWIYNPNDNASGYVHLSLAQFNLLGLDLSRNYQLDYYENDEGGWGWNQLRQVAIAAIVPEPGSATLAIIGLAFLLRRRK